jgi:hypothetical protein
LFLYCHPDNCLSDGGLGSPLMKPVSWTQSHNVADFWLPSDTNCVVHEISVHCNVTSTLSSLAKDCR